MIILYVHSTLYTHSTQFTIQFLSIAVHTYHTALHTILFSAYCIHTILHCILHTIMLLLLLLIFLSSSYLHLLMSITDIPHKPQKMPHHLWQRIKAHIRHSSLCTLLPHNYCH